MVGFISWTLLNERPVVIFSIFTIVGLIPLIGHKIRIPKYLVFYGLFCMIELISKYVVNSHPLLIDVNFRKSLYYFISFFALLIIENTYYSQRFLYNVSTYLKLFLILAATVSVIQFLIYPHLFVNIKSIEGYHYFQQSSSELRLTSIFSWGDSFHDLGLGIPIYTSLIIGLGLKYNKSKIIETIASGIIVLFSLARFAIGGFIIALFQFFKSKNKLRYLFLLFGILIITFFITEILGFDFTFFFEKRLTDTTYESRIIAIYAFLETFPNAVFWGTGGVTTYNLELIYGYSTRIHNGYLAIPYYYGIIGSIFYFSFLIYLSKYIYKVAKKTNYWGIFYATLIFYFANVTVDINDFMLPSLLIMMVFNKHFFDKH